MNNKTLFILTGVMAAGVVKATERPNIVIIVADDLGWGDVSFHGSTIQTPNIDRIAHEGIELDRYYAAPISTPSRAGLLTGRYPNRFGFREAVIPPWRADGLDEHERTMADVLGENGYRNRAIVGKWHLGHTRKVHYPLNRGFTHFYGFLNGAVDYFSHLRDGELDWHDDWETCHDRGYTTDLITDEAVKCIERYAQEGPYLLCVTYNAPHSPYQAPDDEIAEHIPLKRFRALKTKKEKDGWRYRAMVTRMDKGVGRIWQALQASGQLDNTLVLFMSDNGGVGGLRPFSTNAPLRGHKFEEWEGGVRVVAAVYWKKGFVQGNRKLNQVTGIVDILPTIADILQVKTQPQRAYDGRSIYSVLRGEKRHIDRMMYLGRGATVTDDLKLIRAGRNPRLGLKEDWLTDLKHNPSEKDEALHGRKYRKRMKRLETFTLRYDTITPYVPEQPYDRGKSGFKAPKEWRVTLP